MKNVKPAHRAGWGRLRLTAAGAAFCGVCGSSWAGNIDTGNPDLKLSWDNTVTYNLGIRAQSPDPTIYRNPLYQGADLEYGAGAITTNRLDLLSEIDLDYQNMVGLRASGSGWYDEAFHGNVNYASGNFNAVDALDPTQTVAVLYSQLGAYANNEYSSYVKRWYRGPSGELLDSFAYANFNLGDVVMNVKAGRYDLYWGESLFNLADSIAYSQSPVDLRKAAATPGSQAKVLFLPLAQVSTTAQLTSELAFSAQYYLEWEQSRFPEAGTYFGGPDILLNGPDRFFTGYAIPTPVGPDPLFLDRIGIDKPHNGGNWGAFLKWSPAWLSGNVGAYYRKFDETLPWVLAGPVGAQATTYYHAVYPTNTTLYGLSASKNIGDFSFAAEASYRHNTGLNTAFAPIQTGARGNLFNALASVVDVISQNSVWSLLSIEGELAYSHFVAVNTEASDLNLIGYACTSRLAGCSTRNYLGIQLAADPNWVQVFQGIDIDFPVAFGMGLYGNSAATASTDNAQGAGSYSVGPKFTYLTKYTATIAYNGFFSHFNTAGGLVSTPDGAVDNDRGWVSLTLQGAF
jgi:hypothetical protein